MQYCPTYHCHHYHTYRKLQIVGRTHITTECLHHYTWETKRNEAKQIPTFYSRLGEVLISDSHHHILLEKQLGKEHPENIVNEEKGEDYNHHLQILNPNCGNTTESDANANEVVINERTGEHPEKYHSRPIYQQLGAIKYAAITEKTSRAIRRDRLLLIISPILDTDSSTQNEKVLPNTYTHKSRMKRQWIPLANSAS